jgi:hypothetical protein
VLLGDTLTSSRRLGNERRNMIIFKGNSYSGDIILGTRGEATIVKALELYTVQGTDAEKVREAVRLLKHLGIRY